MFECRECGGKTKVTNTITKEDCIIRKRMCLRCQRHFFTKEVFDDWTETVIREKVEAGELMLPKKQKVQLTGKRSDATWQPKQIDWAKWTQKLNEFDDSDVTYNESKGDDHDNR